MCARLVQNLRKLKWGHMLGHLRMLCYIHGRQQMIPRERETELKPFQESISHHLLGNGKDLPGPKPSSDICRNMDGSEVHPFQTPRPSNPQSELFAIHNATMYVSA